MRPDEVESIPDYVMNVFNIPLASRAKVEGALTTLTKYRTASHPEFANFFARFDGSAGQLQPTPLTVQETAASIEKVECLTECFPGALPADKGEFRSIRLRNASDRVLFTDERNPLYLSYRIFTLNEELIPFEGSRSQLPCPLRPGGELTVPVMVKLPEGLTGQFIVRFYFLLANHPVTENVPDPPSLGELPARRWIPAWLSHLRPRPHAESLLEQVTHPREDLHWFDDVPLVEMRITAITTKAEFPAIYRGGLEDFDVQQDVNRAEAFLAEVIDDVRSHGVAKPRILEIGAGVYPISLRVCDQNTTVIASDISLVMQTLASIMHSNDPAVLEGRAAFASFDMIHPPFRDGTFDVICICAALHHIASPDEFLMRLAPILSAHGRFVALREPCVVDPSAPTYIAELTNGFNEQMFELSEWSAILARGSFAVDRAVIDFGCSLKFSARVVREGE